MNDQTTPNARDDCDHPELLSELHVPACLHAVLDMGQVASPKAAKAYVDELAKEAKRANDPVEAMMVEQLALAHHRIASLHARAAAADGIRGVEVYSSAAQRLLDEFRRLTLTLRDYRTPIQGRSTTVVHRVEQFNQARGDQDVTYAKADSPEGGSRLNCRDTELGSTEHEEGDNDLHERRRRAQESASRGGRPLEPAEA